MRRSQLPLTLALIAFGLTLISGGYAYSHLLRTVPVLVAAQDIAAGTEVTSDMVRLIRVPASGAGIGALYGPGQVSGKYAAAPIFNGEVLTARHLSAQPPVKDPLEILSAGERVVSVPVKLETVLGGALRAGDKVDVVAAYPPAGEGKTSPVEVLATGVQVVDLRNSAALSTEGKKDSSSADDDAIPTSVLLRVSTVQAKGIVSSVESKATIYLWLVGRDRQ